MIDLKKKVDNFWRENSKFFSKDESNKFLDAQYAIARSVASGYGSLGA